MKTYKLPLVSGDEIIFRSLSAEDADRFYFNFTTLSQNPLTEEYLFNIITDGRYADRINLFDAGIVLLVLYAAFSFSGVLKDIKEFPDMVEAARNKSVGSIYNMLYVSILKAMPSYKLSELQSMSLNELLDTFALSERVNEKSAIDLNSLRNILQAPIKKQKKGELKEGENVALVKDDKLLKSLQSALDEMEAGDFDEFGRYIGNGSLM